LSSYFSSTINPSTTSLLLSTLQQLLFYYQLSNSFSSTINSPTASLLQPLFQRPLIYNQAFWKVNSLFRSLQQLLPNMTRKRKDFLWGNELPGSSSVLNSPQQDVKETYQFYCYKYRLDPKYNDFADLEIKDGAWRRACTFVKCREWSSKVSSLLYGVPHDLIHSDYLMRAKSVDSDQASQLILGGFWHHHGHRSESTHVHHTYFVCIPSFVLKKLETNKACIALQNRRTANSNCTHAVCTLSNPSLCGDTRARQRCHRHRRGIHTSQVAEHGRLYTRTRRTRHHCTRGRALGCQFYS
jgi:hypothetical protein